MDYSELVQQYFERSVALQWYWTVYVLVIGGAMANTFLKAQGFPVGKSLHEPALLDTAREILAKAKARADKAEKDLAVARGRAQAAERGMQQITALEEQLTSATGRAEKADRPVRMTFRDRDGRKPLDRLGDPEPILERLAEGQALLEEGDRALMMSPCRLHHCLDARRDCQRPPVVELSPQGLAAF